MDPQHFDEELTLESWVGRKRSTMKRRPASSRESSQDGVDDSSSQTENITLISDADVSNEDCAMNDKYSILVLVLLYIIQGVPLGLTFGSVPFLLQESSSYTDIGVFSFAAYPYSLKLLWSPIVDSVFVTSFGRRKSWIIPIQLTVGLIMVFFCDVIQSYVMPEAPNRKANVHLLTAMFFCLVLLVATQDIAVDGWAITMLSKSNRGLASTCQSVGQNIGFFMSYTVFLALSSSKFCNHYLRSVPVDTPIATLSSYMFIWGIIMITATIFIWLFKAEKREKDSKDQSILSTYVDIWNVISLPSMQHLLFALLTLRVAFAASDNVTVLKLIEKGFPRETMAFMVFLSFPFDVALPIFISKWTRRKGNQPLHAFLFAFPFRIIMTLAGLLIVYLFPSDLKDQHIGVYAIVFIVQILYSFTSNTMFVSQCSFFAEICDPAIGGTYMTLMNTVANLGGTWPKFFVLWSVDFFTTTTCTTPPSSDSVNAGESMGEVCVTERDGYYIMGVMCALYGVVWLAMMRKPLMAIQALDSSVWKLRNMPKAD